MRRRSGKARKLERGAPALALSTIGVAAVWLSACGEDEMTEPTPQSPTTMRLSIPTTATATATTIPIYTEPTTVSNPTVAATTRTTTTLTTTTLPSLTTTPPTSTTTSASSGDTGDQPQAEPPAPASAPWSAR